jgi:hypothetical protein
MARETRFGLFLAALMLFSAAVAASAGPRDARPAPQLPAHAIVVPH